MKRLVPVAIVLLALLGWLVFALAGERGPVAGRASEELASGAAGEPAELSMPVRAGRSEPSATQREPSLELEEPTNRAQSSGSPAEESVAFHGRILDALSRRPLAGARALTTMSKRNPPVSELGPEEIEGEATSDAQGRFVLWLPARRPLRLGRVTAAGYGEGTFLVDARHDAPERAETIELLPEARLRVRVLGAGGEALQRIQTDLVWPGGSHILANHVLHVRERVRWTAHTDGEGEALFAGLPAETELVWNLLAPDDGKGRVGRIALAPGEERRLEVSLGGGAELFGHVRAADGAPVPGLGVWLARASTDSEPEQGLGKALSDENGRFVFEDVPFGSYRLGPAPGENDYVGARMDLVQVDLSLVEHDLEVRRGLFLSGRAVGPEVEVAALELVSARPLDGADPGGADSIEGTIERGAFRIGPCAPGEYLVSAAGGDTATRVVRASAGADDLELPVETSRSITIRVVGAEGEVGWMIGDVGRQTGWLHSSSNPVFRRTFPPGTHTLLATDASDGVAFARLEVGPDTPEELVLRLEPGARCTFVHHARSGIRTVRLSLEGEALPLWFQGVSSEPVLPGASVTLLLPPRALVAELLEGRRVVARESLTLAPGERRRVLLEPR